MHPIQQKILTLLDSCDLGKLSLRKIGQIVGIGDNHPQKIEFHLQQLERKSFIKRDKKRHMIKRLKGKIDNDFLISIPILSPINCGQKGCLAEEKIEGFLRLSGSILNKKTIKGLFALKAVDSSMNNARVNGKDAIEDGDYVIVDSKAKQGEYVVSVIDGLAEIKKYIKEVDRIILVSESKDDLPPIYIHKKDMVDYLICGKVVQVIKKLTI